MTALEQHVLDVIQDAFPLEERPYQVLADMLNAQGSTGEPTREPFTEQSVFDAVESLRQSGIIRRIGGIYDSHKLGFISRLCAGKVPTIATGASDDSALEKFAAEVNEIHAITHNYVRSHEYNVWFTVIAQSEEEIHRVVDGLCAATALHDVHVLPATKKFKINTVMGKDTGERGEARKSLPSVTLSNAKDPDSKELSDFDCARIRIACGDIPHSLTPFNDWGISVEELRSDIAGGFMRRFGAVLRHQQAGFAYNAMVCFGLDERGETKDVRGAALAKNSHVSHCYERPAFEGFPYTLYAMMHAQTAAELDRYVKDAAQSIDCCDYVVLHSVRELKKTSYWYFM